MARAYILLMILMAASGLAAADDRDRPKPAVVTFKKLPVPPGDDDVSYKVSLVVTLEGTAETLASRDNSFGAGGSAEAGAGFFETVIEQHAGWVCRADKDSLLIEGWRDPKTGTFHRVKDVQFSSPDLPGAYWPAITLPGKKK